MLLRNRTLFRRLTRSCGFQVSLPKSMRTLENSMLKFYHKKIFAFPNKVESLGESYFLRLTRRNYNTVKVTDTHVTSFTEIKRSLKNYGLSFEDGHACIAVDCPVCVYTKNLTPGMVYINKTTGFFVCHSCKHSGEWELLDKVMQQNKKKKALSELERNILIKGTIVPNEIKALWEHIVDTTVAVNTIDEPEIHNLLNNFRINKTSLPIVLQCDARIDMESSKLYFPLHSAKGEVAGIKVLTTSDEQTVPHSGCAGLLNPKSVKSSKQLTAVLVPSVPDALVLLSQKPTFHVLCLPHGITSLPQLLLPHLEHYNKIVLWLGNDVGSWDAARNFAKKLSEKRCYFVRPTDKQASASIAFNLGQDLKGIVAAAQPVWHQAITTFSSLRQDVLSELQNNDKVLGVKWKRFPSLNKILKGHRRGEFTVLTGPTGSGKTTFMSSQEQIQW